jgi:hypothetical protein
MADNEYRRVYRETPGVLDTAAGPLNPVLTIMSEIKHDFIAIDEGRGRLLRVNERDPSQDWTVAIGQAQPRDMQLAGGGRILISHDCGFSEFDIATGERLAEFTALSGVTAARRQPDGHTLVAGVNLAGIAGVAVLELDAAHREVRRSVFPGDYVRLIRQTEQGTWLMCCNTMIREGSPDGKYLREFPVEGFLHAWKAVRLAGGNLLVAAGYGAFMVELDPVGKVIRKWGGPESVPAAVHPFFAAMFQLLPNGHTVMANWQGHGPGHGGEGIQMLEFDTAGRIVWSWSRADRISSLQGVVVLDGLDVSRLHDERCGIMMPC